MEQLANPETWIALATLTALELVLGDLGYRAPTAGAGAARAVEVFAQLETSRV